MKFVFTLILFVMPLFVGAQEVHDDLHETIEAEVIEVVDEFTRDVFGTDVDVDVQILRAKIETGVLAGETVEFENEMIPLKEGDVVYLNHMITINGDEYYFFHDFKRQNQVMWLFASFAGLLIIFAGWQGIRALLSLGLSVLAIAFLLIPALLNGYNPALVSLGIAGIILACVLFITHGINPRTTIAFMGTFTAVVVTCGLAWFWVFALKLTGFGSETAVYLNFSTDGRLDFAGLLLGSIIIGIIGVLDDVSITQASVVQELRQANKNLGLYELYQRAIRVGRDHVGSLVNTLALAYIGVSLPLILLFANAESNLYLSLNHEQVAAELVRILVGSMGLVLAVPLTTIMAAWYFSSHDVDDNELASHGHAHHHH